MTATVTVAFLIILLPLCAFSKAADKNCTHTVPTEVGPYYKAGAPLRDNITICCLEQHENGSQLRVHGRVFDSDCKTGVESILDIWSADPDGHYSPLEGPDFTCRGKIKSNASGHYEFFSVVPGAYESDGSCRPAHIHYKITRVHGDKTTLTIQQYFEDDPYFENDPCGLDCHAGDPTLTVPLQSIMTSREQSYVINFDIFLP